LLPPIPNRLSRIDATTLDQHFFLQPTDACFYIWEYTRRVGYHASPTNSLIANFKKKPLRIVDNPPEQSHKQRAIHHCAAALRALIERSWLETQATLVPVPGSKLPGHPDHDDRLIQLLQRAFQNYALDARPLIEQTQSTRADHERSARQRFDELIEITRINEAAAQPTRPILVVVDDVLNTGKHFKVAEQLLAQRFPSATIRGLFLARCRHQSAAPASP